MLILWGYALREVHNINISHTMVANYAKTAAVIIKPFVDNYDYRPSNTVVGNIQRYAERIIANGWDVTNYNRPYETLQTAISEIFFNRFLKIEQRSFYEIPSLEIIKER